MATVNLDFTRLKNVLRDKAKAKMLIACEIVEAEEKYFCPVAHGDLREKFTHEVIVSENEIIGRLSNNSDHAAYVEFGTKPHIIEPVNAKVLAFKVNGKMVFTKKVNHPGTQAIPFMRSALISKKREVLQILALQ